MMHSTCSDKRITNPGMTPLPEVTSPRDKSIAGSLDVTAFHDDDNDNNDDDGTIGSPGRLARSRFSSSGTKVLELNFARRPGYNLLSKYGVSGNSNTVTRAETNTASSNSNSKGTKLDTETELDLTVPKRHYITRGERPISNDSIATRASDIFSSPGMDMHSRNSSIGNDDSDVDDSTNITSKVYPNKTWSGSMGHMFEGNSTILNSTDTIDNMSETADPRSSNKAMRKHSFSSGLVMDFKSGPYSNANSFVSFVPVKSKKPFASYSSHSQSMTAITLGGKGQLTPSQRYRLRREQKEQSLRNSIKQKEKFYDDQDGDLELQEGDVDDSLIWNIPMAPFSTSSFLNAESSMLSHSNHGKHGTSVQRSPRGKKSSRSLRMSGQKGSHSSTAIPPNVHEDIRAATPPGKAIDGSHNSLNGNSNGNGNGSNLTVLDFFQMPTSPIPGINGVSDFQFFKSTTKNLSSVYLHSSSMLSRTKLSERTNSTEFLPVELQEACDMGMEDKLLVSEDKLEVLSHSRPSWLPPKDPEEKRNHEEQISKNISVASIEQLSRNRDRDERIARNETNKIRVSETLERGILRNSSLNTLRKIVWESSISEGVRHRVYNELLQTKDCFVTKHYVEPYEDVLKLLEGMCFPRGKEYELRQLIDRRIRNKRSGQEENQVISEDLMKLLQMKSISSQGLVTGDELLFHHFLNDKSFESLGDIWEMVNLIQMTCFSEPCKLKYDTRIVQPRGIVAKYLLRTDDFKQEFNSTCLNSSTWWNILEKVDHSLFMWIMDIIVVANSQNSKYFPQSESDFKGQDWETYRSKYVAVNYKVLASLTLNVLLNYHFGFNDLIELGDLPDKKFAIPMATDDVVDADMVNASFVKKWQHYYRKF